MVFHFYIIKSTIEPIITPTKYIIGKIAIFPFIFFFVLNNNNIPKPLPVSKPESIVPTLIIFDKYNSVIITLPAQLGIKPTKLDKK